MQKLVVFLVTLLLLAQNSFAQDVTDTQKTKSSLNLKTKFVPKKGTGFYISGGDAYNPGGIIINSVAGHALGGSSATTYSDIKQTPGGSGSIGIEFMFKEIWRWYSLFAFGLSDYSYTVNALATNTQYIYAFASSSSTQYSTSLLYEYTLLDFTFRNYLMIFETHSQRLGLSLGINISNDISDNTNNNADSNNIPPLAFFVSPGMRYDIAFSSKIFISIEPYYNLELRSAPKNDPRLVFFGVKLSMLFN
ncbi:MAG TPA: hypothetical protein VK808_12300 [Bacteroidia bacterium]|jgi:hypothetical protein|nr:hypothetical protein [Bacteroidia bacterium]